MTKLSLTLVQCHLEWKTLRKIDTTYSSYWHLWTTRMLLYYELFTTAFSITASPESMSGDSVQWMKNLAKNRDALIIGSLIIHDQAHKYNRLLCVFPNGTIQYYYDKRHLFKLIDESLHFTAGKNRLIVNYKGWRICPLICYDLRFPVFSRNNHDYDLLIYVANWPVSRIHHWTKLLDARAIENQSYVLGVNRVGEDENGVVFNGKSRLVDATGNLLFEGDNNEQVQTCQLDYRELIAIRKKHPF